MAWQGIALAMVIEPEILFLDEPAASVEKSNIGIIKEIILGMKKESRIIVIMTTHDARQAELLADTLIQIKGGKIISL